MPDLEDSTASMSEAAVPEPDLLLPDGESPVANNDVSIIVRMVAICIWPASYRELLCSYQQATARLAEGWG